MNHDDFTTQWICTILVMTLLCCLWEVSNVSTLSHPLIFSMQLHISEKWLSTACEMRERRIPRDTWVLNMCHDNDLNVFYQQEVCDDSKISIWKLIFMSERDKNLIFSAFYFIFSQAKIFNKVHKEFKFYFYFFRLNFFFFFKLKEKGKKFFWTNFSFIILYFIW